MTAVQSSPQQTAAASSSTGSRPEVQTVEQHIVEFVSDSGERGRCSISPEISHR